MGLTNNLGKLSNMITSTGSAVGIGTTSPNDLLEVRGGFIRLSATAGNGPQFNIYSNGQTSNHITLAQGFALATDNIGYLYNRANADFVFGTNNSERMRISASGNVGIGATPTDFGASYTVLDVYNGTVGGYLLARSPNVTGQISVDNNTAMYVQSRTNHPIVFAPNNSEKMRITTAGNVGIGTSSPSDIIDVRKNQNGITNFYFQNTDTTNTNSRAYINVVSGNTTLLLQSIHSDNTYVKPSTATGLYLGYDNFLKLTGGANIEYNVVPNAYYHIATDNAKISVASGGTLNFGTFSGFIMVNNHSNGYVGIFLCGAGTTSLVSYTGSTSGLGTLAYNGGINGYTWTSTYGATAFYGFFVIRTRQNA